MSQKKAKKKEEGRQQSIKNEVPDFKKQIDEARKATNVAEERAKKASGRYFAMPWV